MTASHVLALIREPMNRLLMAMGLARRMGSSLTTATPVSSAQNRDKPFDDIPGPHPWPLVGNKWRYVPLIGEYKVHEMDVNSELKLQKYGPIVREVLDKDLTILHVFDPKDMEAVFRQEGRYPMRRSHRALMKYRMDRPDRYASGGLFPENGERWYRLRRQFQQQLMSAGNVGHYVGPCERITDELIDYIRRRRDGRQEMDDFLRELYVWSLYNTGVLALDSDLCGSDPYGRDADEDSDVRRLIRAAHDTNEAVMLTEMTDRWQTRDTRDYRRLTAAQDCMADFIDSRLRAKEAELLKSGPSVATNQSILQQFLSDPQIDRKDLLAMMVDLFLAGIDTTAFTAGFALYHLSRNESAQQRLRQEVDSLLKTSDGDGYRPLTPELLSRMSYLKACVKETLRMTPVAFGVGRVTTANMSIAGYRVPKGTQIITENQVACRQSQYFPDPYAFRPERWLKNNDHNLDSTLCPALGAKRSPFLLLPFGYGPRMCIGRRFAEMEIYVFLAKIIGNFRIQYHYEDIRLKTRLINVPNKPLRLKFIDV